jgi:hypothetical protein
MEVDRIPHMGGAVRDESPTWGKPGTRRRPPAPDPKPDDEVVDDAAATLLPDEQPRDGALDVLA